MPSRDAIVSRRNSSSKAASILARSPLASRSSCNTLIAARERCQTARALWSEASGDERLLVSRQPVVDEPFQEIGVELGILKRQTINSKPEFPQRFHPRTGPAVPDPQKSLPSAAGSRHRLYEVGPLAQADFGQDFGYQFLLRTKVTESSIRELVLTAAANGRSESPARPCPTMYSTISSSSSARRSHCAGGVITEPSSHVTIVSVQEQYLKRAFQSNAGRI